MKKKILVLPCIAAVAIATFVGTKTLGTNASESNPLLSRNVEALASASSESANSNPTICYPESKVAKSHTYYDCRTCEKVYDEKGKGKYSKCD